MDVPEIYQSPGLVVVSEFLTAILQSMEDISWTKGRHNMRFGGQFTYIQLNEAYGAYAQAVEQLGAILPAGTKR
jgi:hypothetical protein